MIFSANDPESGILNSCSLRFGCPFLVGSHLGCLLDVSIGTAFGRGDLLPWTTASSPCALDAPTSSVTISRTRLTKQPSCNHILDDASWLDLILPGELALPTTTALYFCLRTANAGGLYTTRCVAPVMLLRQEGKLAL
jgi:hypothetical protein